MILGNNGHRSVNSPTPTVPLSKQPHGFHIHAPTLGIRLYPDSPRRPARQASLSRIDPFLAGPLLPRLQPTITPEWAGRIDTRAGLFYANNTETFLMSRIVHAIIQIRACSTGVVSPNFPTFLFFFDLFFYFFFFPLFFLFFFQFPFPTLVAFCITYQF